MSSDIRGSDSFLKLFDNLLKFGAPSDEESRAIFEETTNELRKEFQHLRYGVEHYKQ